MNGAAPLKCACCRGKRRETMAEVTEDRVLVIKDRRHGQLHVAYLCLDTLLDQGYKEDTEEAQGKPE